MPDEATPKPWDKPVDGSSFHPDYPTEFKPSGIPGAGRGWFAKCKIPKGTRLRRVSIEEGTLLRFGSMDELKATGWDVDETVHYGIGHKNDSDAIFFLNPGTACNHADPTRTASVGYNHEEVGALEIWTLQDVAEGEEMFNIYTKDFPKVPWFDEYMKSKDLVPLTYLGEQIDEMVQKATA